jgi:hydrogenase expression/formation protein HypC
MCLAIPGRIVELVKEDPSLAIVDVLSVRRKIDLGLLTEDRPVPGDWVLIHVGFAMSKVSEADALTTLRMLEELGEAEVAAEEVRGYGLGESEAAGERAGPGLSG